MPREGGWLLGTLPTSAIVRATRSWPCTGGMWAVVRSLTLLLGSLQLRESPAGAPSSCRPALVRAPEPELPLLLRGGASLCQTRALALRSAGWLTGGFARAAQSLG